MEEVAIAVGFVQKVKNALTSAKDKTIEHLKRCKAKCHSDCVCEVEDKETPNVPKRSPMKSKTP